MKKLLFIAAAFSSCVFDAQNIVLQEFASGLSNPVEIKNANDSHLLAAAFIRHYTVNTFSQTTALPKSE